MNIAKRIIGYGLLAAVTVLSIVLLTAQDQMPLWLYYAVVFGLGGTLISSYIGIFAHALTNRKTRNNDSSGNPV